MTQRAYVEQVSRFARHFGQSPERLGPDEIRAWQILPGRGETPGGQFDFGRRGRAPVRLHRHPQTTLDCRRRHPDRPAADRNSPLCRARRKSPVPGRGEKPETSDDPDRVLRDGSAHFRSGLPEARRDRQPADGHPGGGGQRPEGPLRDALAEAVGDFCGTTGRTARPKEWLFPGDRPEQPITACAVEIACRQALEQSGHRQSRSPRIPCAMRSPFTCWSPAPICAPSNCCWGIAA